jgi:hypothetical protein
MTDWLLALLFCALVAGVGWPWVTVLVGGRPPLAGALGLAYLIGAALTTLGMLAVAFVELPVNRATVLLEMAAVAALGIALARRRAPRAVTPAIPGPMLAALPALAVAVAALAAGTIQAFLIGPASHTDFINAWGLKALAVFEEQDLDFEHVQTVHAYYPLLISNLHGALHLFVGTVDDRLVRIPQAGIGLALAGSMWWLCRTFLPPAGAALALALAAVTHDFVEAMTLGLADMGVAAYVLVCALAAYRWLLDGGSAYAALSGFAAGGAAWTKVEGGLTCLVVIATVVLLRRSLRVPGLLAWIGWFAAFTVPWQVFRRLHDVQFSDRHFRELFLDVGWIAENVATQLARTEHWGIFWPLCTALVLVTAPLWLRAASGRLLAAVILPNIVLSAGAYVTHWSTGTEVSIASSLDRIYLHVQPTMAVMAAAGVTLAWQYLAVPRAARERPRGRPAGAARAPAEPVSR